MSDTETNNETKNQEQGPQPKDRTTFIVLSSVLLIIVIAAGVLLWKANILKTGPKPLALISGSGPAIVIGSESISKGQLNKQINLQVALLKQFFATQGKPFDPYSKENTQIIGQLKQNVIQGLVTLTLLVNYAKQKGITVSDAEVNSTLSGLEQRFGKDKFSSVLNESGMTMDEIKQQIKDQLIAKDIFTGLEKAVHVTDADEKAFYEQHKEQFNAPEEVNARHILVKTKAEAEKIEKQLKAGKSFTELAMKNSIDKASAAKGGELGFFSANQMVPAFSKAAFALKKPGQISPIVETQYGYHIIQLIAKKPGKAMTFAQIKPQLEQILLQQKTKDDFEKLINGLKAKTKIDIKVQ
ncbi:MAG: peptidylprolyl isomerase [Deltaproteobacteria bacterium]|nr:peptidylprolyl isomerase [Deltaproteobacteria bacterium]MCL5277338.1 peptidylprolyl isomerase [Deltaproteobacteria bacterium]